MSKQEGTPKGPASSSWSPGEIVFDKFEVIELIGSGARGKIFKVNQIDLQRVAALKVLQTNAPSSKAILRFQNEARAVSRLSHPNIAKVLDFGIKNNQLFMAMEFVNGINLEDLLLRHKTLSVERVLHIFSQVSDALAHAHAKGIIHRDIKPSNIMIEDASSDASLIKVLDFGLAKIIGDEPNEGYLTDPDALIGSPLYMSPDQALGKGPSPQSDLYSVGCVMFHCLTGRPPFMGSTPLETLAKHRDEQAPNLGKLLSDTEPSQMVAHVVNKLLRKNPENRFQSSKELMIELKFLLGVSIEDPDDKKALATKYGLNEPESSSSIAEAAEKKPPCEIKMTPGKASLWKELRVPIAIVSFICAASGLSILYFINRPGIDMHTEQDLKDRALYADNIQAAPDPSSDKQLMQKRIKSKERVFNLTDPDVNDADLKHFLDAIGVERIYLSGSNVTDDGISNLRHLNLVTLSLDNTKVKSLSALADMTSLRELQLSNTDVDDAALKNLRNKPNLSHLNLDGTKVTADGVLSLASLPSLTYLSLNGCDKIKASDIEKLKREMPLCLFPPERASQWDKALKEVRETNSNANQAYTQLSACLIAIERHFGKNSSRVIVPLGLLSTTAARLHKNKEAEELLKRAALAARLSKSPEGDLFVHEQLFAQDIIKDDLDGAANQARINRKMREKNGDRGLSASSNELFSLASEYERQKRYGQAAMNYKACMDLRSQIKAGPSERIHTNEEIERLFGENGLLTRAARIHFGVALMKSGKEADGAEELQIALNRRPELLSHELGLWSSFVSGYWVLGNYQLNTNKVYEAKQTMDDCLHLCEQFPQNVAEIGLTKEYQAKINKAIIAKNRAK